MVYHAAVRGIKLDKVESKLEGDLDLRGFLALADDVRPGYEEIRVKFTVKTDLENLETGRPVAKNDLPVGGRRIMQPVQGYKATFVNGVQTRKDDQDTGARPGRVARAA